MLKLKTLGRKYSVVLFIALIVFSVIVTLYVGATFKLDDTLLRYDMPTDYNTGWYTLNENNDAVFLGQVTRKEAGAEKSTLTLYNVLPDNLNDESVICFPSKNERITVSVGGETVFRYGHEDKAAFGWEYGTVFVVCPLDASMSGGEVKIELTPMRGRTGEDPYTFGIGSKSSVFISLLKRETAVIIICTLLLLISVMFFVFSAAFAIKKDKRAGQFLFFGMYIFISTLWAFSDALLFQFIFGNKAISYIIFNITFNLIPVAASLFMSASLPDKKRFYDVLAAVSAVYAATRTVLYMCGVCDFETALYIVHIIMFFFIISTLVFLITDYIKRKVTLGNSFLLAIAFLSVFESVPLVLFYVNDVLDRQRFGYATGFYYGNLIFVLIITLGLFKNDIALQAKALRLQYYEQLAYYDDKTGMLNTRGIDEMSASVLKKNPGHVYAALDFDINGFSEYNTINGYERGDYIILTISKILASNCRRGELAARVGADHFIALIYGTDIKSIYDRVLNADKIYKEKNYDSGIRISYGIAPLEGRDREAFVRARDNAKEAKRNIKGKYSNNISVFNSDIHEKILTDTKIVSSFESDMKKGKYRIFFQPQYDIATGAIVCSEALSRKVDNGILIPPSVYIPPLEKNGLITKLDIYMLTEACHLLESCIKNNYKMLPVAVNFSRYNLYNPSFVDEITYIAKCHNIPAEFLEIELTETAFDIKNEVITANLKKLHERGFRILIDDFGSGYSSFNMLKDIEVDRLKIDREFFTSGKNIEKANIIIKNIISMSKELGIGTIAEGVETEEQYDFLKLCGCDTVQGFYMSEPLPSDEYIIRYL